MTIAKYLRNISRKAVDDNPKEDVAYAVFVEFLGQHKTPAERFVIYSRLSLKWKPDIKEDRRLEIPDLGVGNFTTVGVTPPFKLRFGVEAKRAIEEMKGLPPASSIINIDEVRAAFHTLYFQAQDQAKAAIKGQYPLLGGTVQWILLIGPYWVPVEFGPFTEAELTVRAHKKESPSGDWLVQAIINKQKDGPPHSLAELNLLCENSSFTRLEQIISGTDVHAQPFINALMACEFSICLTINANMFSVGFNLFPRSVIHTREYNLHVDILKLQCFRAVVELLVGEGRRGTRHILQVPNLYNLY